MDDNNIEVWGFKTFRPFRIYWALEEFNLKYKSHKIGSRTGETQTNEYLEMNPKGKIPFFKHKNIGISESVAAMNYVVNNFSVPKDFYLPTSPKDKAKIDDWDAMIDSNVKGLMYVTKAIIPFMVKNKSGHIINVGSIAGKEVYPKGSVYCSSKFAVDAFTQGLRVDLLKFGIKVSAINPGLVETEFSLVRFKGDNSRAKKVYSGLKPLTAEDVAKSIIYIANTPSHVTIADMVLLPSHQANAYVNIRSK